jgi:hypothetical protein
MFIPLYAAAFGSAISAQKVVNAATAAARGVRFSGIGAEAACIVHGLPVAALL